MKLRSWKTRRRRARPGLRARARRRSSSPPESVTAIAFTVKSRRARSSSMLAGSTSGSAPGCRVALAARHRDRRPASRGRGCRCTETPRAPSTSPPSERASGRSVALDDEVDLARVAPEQCVAHEAADAPPRAGRPRERRVARRARASTTPDRTRRRPSASHGDPCGGEVLLGLRDGELVVVEDRRAEHGVGAGLRARRQGDRACPAPPEAITGTPTASPTARVSARS